MTLLELVEPVKLSLVVSMVAEPASSLILSMVMGAEIVPNTKTQIHLNSGFHRHKSSYPGQISHVSVEWGTVWLII